MAHPRRLWSPISNFVAGIALCTSPLAYAQNAAENSVEVAPPPTASSPPSGAGTPQSAPTAEHAVQTGDTLWGITQQYLGSPWYWPKVWSYNPQIANPHWIYPGNVVRFYGGGEEGPTQVAIRPVSKIATSTRIGDDPAPFEVVGPLVYSAARGPMIPVPIFITPRDLEETGSIVASFAQMAMLSFPETFYAKFKAPPKLGVAYLILRTVPAPTDPETFATLGYMTRIVGAARVLRLDESGLAVMEIVKQQDEILRGDRIGPYGEPIVRPLVSRPAQRDVLGGRVVGNYPVAAAMGAQNSYGIMNRGAHQGVEIGNTFTIWRQHDPLKQSAFMNPTVADTALPKEDIASCVVLDVREATSICVYTRSLRPVERGDRADVISRASASR